MACKRKNKNNKRIEHHDYKGDAETTKMIPDDIPQDPGLPDTYAAVVVFKVTVFQRVTKKEGKVFLNTTALFSTTLLNNLAYFLLASE